ncbi:hypothetical protein [Streptomyces sp. NPDC047097]|uniref:hypothetical protein n=1 Tax=Streptomyces sp. NPDC047097 TaxID=3155260 RepID=UPI0033C398B6
MPIDEPARTHRAAVVPSLADTEAVRALVTEGESVTDEDRRLSQAGGGVLLLAILLTANPGRDEEPLEDAFEGSLQSLTCATAF